MSAPAATSRNRLVAVGLCLLLAVWVVPMGLSGTAAVLPTVSADLGADQGWLQWIVNGFNVAFAMCTLLWGVFADRFGGRATFRLGVALYLVAAGAIALAPSLPIVAIARVMAGAAGAAVFTGSALLISNIYADRARSRMFAVYGSTIGLGLAAGPSIAGAIVTILDWRAVYLLHGALLLVALAGSALVPRVSQPTKEKRSEHSNRALLRAPRFLAMCLVAVAGSIAFVTMLTYLPTALSAMLGLGETQIGLWLLPLTVPVFCGPFLGTWLAHRGGRSATTTVIMTGLGLLVVGLAGMLLLSPGRPVAVILLPALLIGTGFGLSLGLVDGDAIRAAPIGSSGTAAGVLNFFRMGSEAVFVAILGAILASTITSQMADSPQADQVISGAPLQPDAYSHGFTVAICTLLGFLLITATMVAVLLRAASKHHVLASPIDPAIPA